MNHLVEVLGLALGLASLVPAFATRERRKKIILVAIGTTLVGIFAYQLYDYVSRQRRIDALRDEITERIVAAGSVTFEQLLEELYYPDFAAANEAIDALVQEGRLRHEVMDVQSASGKEYKVRIYYFVPYIRR